MPAITSYPVTGDNAKAFRALNKFGMHLADFAGLTSNSRFDGFGNGISYTVSDWVSAGVFDNLAAVQAVYPCVQDGYDTVDWVLLQSAVDYMLYGNLGSANRKNTARKLLIPAGKFFCNRSLQVGYTLGDGSPPANLNGNGYTSITLEGEGPQYDSSGNGMQGTTLYFDFTNDVGIALNSGVQNILRGMSIEGKYQYAGANRTAILNGGAAYNVESWRQGGFADVNWIGGAAVNIGVALSPYTSEASAAAYPPRILPSYFGGGTMAGTNSTTGGSDSLLEDVNIANFIIGYGRAHGDSNDEYLRYHRGKLTGCVYGINIGHSQCRNVSIQDCDFNNFHTAIANNGGTWGIANMHGAYDNIHASYGYQVFSHTNGDWSGPVELSRIYGEGLWRVGRLTPMATLKNCYFSFWDAADGDKGSEYMHVEGCEKLTLENSFFSVLNGLMLGLSTNGTSPIVINNGSFVRTLHTTLSSDSTYNAFRYMSGVFARVGCGRYESPAANFIGGYGTYAGYEGFCDRAYINTYPAVDTTAGQVYVDYAPTGRLYASFGGGSATLMGGQYRYNVPKITHQQINLGAMISRSGFDVVFPRYSFGTLKADIGDVFCAGVSGSEDQWLVCVGISGGNMTLRQINNYHGTAVNDYQANGRAQLTVGVTYYATYICTRIKRNAGLVLGSVTSGSAVISNVKAALKTGNAITTDDLTMAAGDLFIHQEVERLNAGGSPVVPLNVVSAVDTVAQTITLTDNFNVTNAHYPVVFYVKVFNA